MECGTRLIIKDRQKGKTTGLLYASEATGYPIVVQCHQRITQLKEQALELGISIPEPLIVAQARAHGRRFDNILVDEGYDIIGEALDMFFGCHVVGLTFSDRLKEAKGRMSIV